MKEIRVLHIGLTSNPGGIEKYVYNLCDMSNKEKIKNEIINANEFEIGFQNDFNKKEIKIIKIPNRKKNYLKHIKELKKVIKNGNYDFVHFHLMDLSCFDRIIIALKYSNAKVILHSHIDNFKKNIVRSILDFVGRQLLKNNKRIIKVACSEDAGKYMFSGFRNKDFEILNNAINIKDFLFNEDLRNKNRKELGVSNKFLIGHVGRFQEQKNHAFILEIFYEILKLNNNGILLLVGEGSLKDEIIKKSKEMKIYEKIIFYGQSNNVNELYQAMDAFLFPSLYEGLGIVLVEAQSCGLKCYASDTIPKEVKILDSLKFIELSKTAEEWAKEIINDINIKYDRIYYSKKMLNSKYNIYLEKKRINDFYEKNCNR